MDNQNFKYNYREGSKIDWGKSSQSPIIPTYDDIKLGAILRIADATELMAQNYLKMQRDLGSAISDRDYYKELYEKEKRSKSALKGQITKFKNSK